MTRPPATSTTAWTKWARMAAVGAASLAVISTTPTTVSAEPAHFRGQVSYAQDIYGGQYLDHPVSRRLDTNATMNEALEKANAIGSSVRKAIKQLRGGTDEFYRDLITAIKIQLCQQLVEGAAPTPNERFVASTDDRAYKFSNGSCVQVLAPKTYTGNQYALNKCEVKPNCYWSEINEGDLERKPVYSFSEADAEEPDPDAMTLQGSSDMLMKWGQGLMIFVVPGIILAVLSLLTMILFLLCRCCCNRCGGRSPREGGYTCMQKFYPLLFFLLFSVGIIAVAASSMLYQKTVTAAVSDVFQAGVDTLDGGNSWITNITTPLIGVRDTVTDTADDIKVQLTGTNFIEDGLDGLVGKLHDFSDGSANRKLPDGCTVSDSEPYCLPCDVCSTISTEVDKSADEIEANAGTGVAQLKDVKVSLNEKLVDIASTVKTTVDSVVDTLATLTTTIDDAKTQVTDVQDQYEKQKQAQTFGVLVPFVLAIVVVVIGFVGVLFGLTPLKFLANIIHIAYIIGFIALVITFILSSIFLAISVVLGDACEVAAIFTEDWTVALGDEAKGLNACFQNASLIDTLDLGESLEFARGGVQFPADMNLAAMLDFQQLDAFNTAIMGTGTETFSLDPNAKSTMITSLGKLVKQSNTPCVPNDVYAADADFLEPWTANGEASGGKTAEEYIEARYSAGTYNTDCDPDNTNTAEQFTCANEPANTCTFAKAVTEIFHNVRMIVLIERDSGDFIDDLHANMTGVMTYTSEFKTKISDFDAKISTIKSDLEGSLIKYVGDFEDAMYCTFISDGFFDIYDALCGDLMPSFTMISLMIFIAGVFLIPVNICLIIAVKRLKARGNGGHVMDNEMKFK